MCGRTVCACAPQQIQAQTKATQCLNVDKYHPSYNVSPRTFQPVLVFENGQRVIKMMEWGLKPSFCQKSSPELNTFNARSEKILSTMWCHLARKKRCVVIADGFFEWMKDNKTGKKRPFYVHAPNGKLLTMAGLWESCKVADKEIMSYTVLTTAVSQQLAFLHDRMPVVLETEDKIDAWLCPGELSTSQVKEQLLPLMEPLENLSYHEVSHLVNSVKNKSPDCITPLKEVQSKGAIHKFFKPQENTIKDEIKEERSIEDEIKEEQIGTSNTRPTKKIKVKE